MRESVIGPTKHPASLPGVTELLLPKVRNAMRQIDRCRTVQTAGEPFERVGDLGPAFLALIESRERPKGALVGSEVRVDALVDLNRGILITALAVLHLGDALEKAALCLVGCMADLRQEQHDEVIPGPGRLEKPVELGARSLVVRIPAQHLAEHIDGGRLVAERVLVELCEPELKRGSVVIGRRVGATLEQRAKRFEPVIVLIQRFERVHRDRVVLVEL